MNKYNGKNKNISIFLTAAVLLQLCIFALPASAASIYSVSPQVLIPGKTEMTIRGSGFGITQSGQSIYFDKTRVSDYTYWSDGEIRFTAPMLRSDGEATIKFCYKNSFLTYSCNDLSRNYFYLRPRVTGISENSASVGDIVSIYGYNFGDQPGIVTVNGAAADIVEWGNHWFSLYGQVARIRVPASTQSGHIVVTTKNGYSSEADAMTEFTVFYSSYVADSGSDVTGAVIGSGSSGNGTGGSGDYGAPTNIALFGNDGKLITNYLPLSNRYDSEYPIVKFDWRGAFSDSGIVGYFVEFTDKKTADPVQTGKFQSSTVYRVYNFAPNQDYNLFIRSIDRNNNISETKCLTYRLQQDAAQISQSLTDRLRGYILIQVDSMGEAWYVRPEDGKKYYLNVPADAFRIMRDFGLGVTDADLARIPEGGSSASGDAALADRLRGKILLQVEGRGEAWYVNPADGKKYYLGNPDQAFKIMKELGLGITDANLKKIWVGELK